jgi:uncharacterized membrane protein (DUF373 family)
MPRQPDDSAPSPSNTRRLLSRAFTWVEDIVYLGLGALLAASALVLLGHAAVGFSHDLVHSVALPGAIVHLLDRLLLVLMIVELLYTVQVSFREHAVVPEPFLIVGLVAVTRRVLVLTAELTGAQSAAADSAFRVTMIELTVLTGMIVALVGSLLMLRRRNPAATATRS